MNKTIVLLVEDNPADAKVALSAFEQINFSYKVIVAEDGVEALDYLFGIGKYAGRDKADTPMLILLDLKLPKIDGLEVLRRMRNDSMLKHLLVAVLTSSNEDGDKIEALKLGATLFLQKAIDFNEFIAIARKVETLLSTVKSHE